MTVTTARRRLAMMWLGVGSLLFILFLGQTLFGRKFGSNLMDAWGWFLPNIIPTLSLIVGSLVQEQRTPSPKAGQADKFLFWLAIGVSAFYFLVLFMVIIGHVFVGAEELNTLEFLNHSSVILGPLQGLAAASIGAFFIKA